MRLLMLLCAMLLAATPAFACTYDNKTAGGSGTDTVATTAPQPPPTPPSQPSG
jgi:hypothetical protein